MLGLRLLFEVEKLSLVDEQKPQVLIRLKKIDKQQKE